MFDCRQKKLIAIKCKRMLQSDGELRRDCLAFLVCIKYRNQRKKICWRLKVTGHLEALDVLRH